jgi:molecular chaperone IbpA
MQSRASRGRHFLNSLFKEQNMTWLVDNRHMFNNWDRHFVGFDRLFDSLAEKSKMVEKSWNNWPPFSISKPEENKYVIEMAVAGFGKQDIEIEVDGDRLSVRGKVQSEPEVGTYLFKGIANREFTRAFTIEDGVVVKGATMANGMLKVFLERLVPEPKKSQKIEIADEGDTASLFAAANPQLLNEADLAETNGKLM